MKQRCINVVPMLCNVFSTLCNVISTLFQRRALTLYQRWKSGVRFCFIFNVELTLFQLWSTTLKQRWSDVEMLAGMIPAVDLKNFLCLFCDSNGIRTQNHLVRKWTLNYLAKYWIPLLLLKLRACFHQGVPWHPKQLSSVDTLWNTYVTW